MRNWTECLRPYLSKLGLEATREADIIEELSQHLDQRYEELRAGGATEQEACWLAMEELGEPGALVRDMRKLRQAYAPPAITLGAPGRFLLADFWQDLRYAARTLRTQPGFLAAAVLTLALGIGANSAIFALVDATLLRPLPVPHPERVVKIWERTETSARARVSPLNLRDWRDNTRTFEAIGGFASSVGGMVMAGKDGTAETVSRQWVTAGFLDALGVKPIVGRTFDRSDDRSRRDAVVLSEGFWRTRYDGDPGVVGTEIRLDGDNHMVLGVVPDEAQLLYGTSIWALLRIEDAPPQARGAHPFQAIGRLKEGVGIEAADADMAAIADGLARAFPATNAGRSVALEPLRDAVLGSELRQTSMLFLGVVGFVLLICCANVANLLLARATVRTRELAIRSALGADRWRIVRQLLTESLLLALVGGALGLALGAAIIRIAPVVIPAGLLPAAVTLHFDSRVVAFCAAAAIFIGLLFGLAPAWQAMGFFSARALASEGRNTTARGGILRHVLVAGEVATAVLLLFGAGLLLRTLVALDHVDRGYRADSVLSMLIDPLSSSYPTDADELRFYQEIEREVRSLPGVQGVAWATTLPMGRSYEGSSFFEIVGDPPPAESQRPRADYQIVSDSYFTTLDLPLVDGRGFDDRDRADAISVCIVNEAFVRRYLNGRPPIGMRVSLRDGGATGPPAVVREIVGVARQVKSRPDETSDLIQIYVPLAQDTPGDIFMLVRPATGRGEALAPSVRAAISRVDRAQLVSVRDVMTLDDVVSEGTSRHRFRAILVVAFAGLALVLAMIGVFGILAYAVQQRLRDFGIRRALGATAGDVVRQVVRSVIPVISAGALVGLALSAALGRLLAALLFGVEPLDPMTFGAVAFVLVLTAVAATAGPAWRAVQIDPITALRGD
jgi:putative ABC transport system permease protein